MLDNNHNSLGLTLNLVPLEVEKTLTTLHAAALDKKNGLVEALRFLKQNQNKILEVVNNNDNNNLQTPMHLSSQSGMLDITKLLMEKGANIHATDKIGRTPFLYAVRYNQLLTVKYLLEKGSNPNDADNYGENALHYCAMHSYHDLASYIINQTKIDINQNNKFGETCLHKAARMSDYEMCKLFLDNGAKKNSRGLCGYPFDLLKVKSGPISQLLSLNKQLNTIEIRKSFREKKISDFIQLDSFSKVVCTFQESTDLKKLLGKDIPISKDLFEGIKQQNYSLLLESDNSETKAFPKYPNILTQFTVNGVLSPYRKIYYEKPHLIFLTKNMFPKESKKKEVDPEYGIFVVRKKVTKENKHPAMLFTMWGTKQLYIPTVNGNTSFEDHVKQHLLFLSYTRPQELYSVITPMALLETGKDMVSMALKMTEERKNHEDWCLVNHVDFPFEVLGLEAQFGMSNCYTIGVVLCKEGQTEEEMFKNQTTPEFEKFLEILGNKIDIKGWSGYRAGLDDEHSAYHTFWEEFELLFIPTTMMNETDQRQYIGNCKTMIYFCDGDFAPRQEFRGKQNSLAIVVQHSIQKPLNFDTYMLSGYTRSKIDFDPMFSQQSLTNKNILKNYLYVSIINGTQAIINSPPLLRIFSRARKTNLTEIIDHYYGTNAQNVEVKNQNPLFGNQDTMERLKIEAITNKLSSMAFGSIELNTSKDNKKKDQK